MSLAGDDLATKPLTARSVLASTMLGVDSAWLPTSALVRSGDLFGLRRGTVRTALSRMVANGEVEAYGDGYRLAGHLLARHARQRQARRQDADEPTDAWDGTWTIAVVVDGARPAEDRARLRIAATRLLLAEARDGVWLRPANLDLAMRDPESHRVVSEQATWFHGARPDDEPALTDRFELDAWAGRARHLLAELERWQARLDAHDADALPPTFHLDAAVQRHLVADPRLPTPLRPPDWPGPELRRCFADFDEAFRATWRAWNLHG